MKEQPLYKSLLKSISIALVAAGVVQSAGGAEDYVRGRLLFKAKPGVGEAEAQALLRGHGATEVDRVDQIGLRIVSVPPNAMEAAYNGLSRNPRTEFVDLDFKSAPDQVSLNDPYFAAEWHLAKTEALTGWETTMGAPQIVVAILDTGVDGSHPDLAANLVQGWNAYDNNSDTSDVHGHGTTVAGAAAAVGNNSVGVVGMASGCRVMPIRISDASGWGYSSTISKGLTYAADHGARVANISYRASTWQAVASAAEYFRSKGGVVVVAAGNEGDFDSSADVPSVLTVSASDQNDLITSWSVRGNLIDLSSPGVSIYTTRRGGGYGGASGTSYSAPVVAGVAALVLSANPSLSPDQVENVLTQSADDLGQAGWDSSYGFGRVNARRALEAALSFSAAPAPAPEPAPEPASDTQAPTATITEPASGSIVSGTTSVRVWAQDDTGVALVSFYVDNRWIGNASSSPFTAEWDTTAEANGLHTLRVVAEDAAGNRGEDSITVSVSNSGADTQAPTISILSPTEGESVWSMTMVDVAASDNTGVARVDLYVDGKRVDQSFDSPFRTRWQAKKANSGPHRVHCVAYDHAGNGTASSAVTVYR